MHQLYNRFHEEYAGLAKVSAMVNRCRLLQPFHLWCIAFAATSQWEHVSNHLDKLLRNTFSGWVQTRINEKGNKVLRDAQMRDNASKAPWRLIFLYELMLYVCVCLSLCMYF